MPDAKVSVMCENPQCSNVGNIVNTISGGQPRDIEMLLDQWDSAHEQADMCQTCGVLGVPYLEN